MSRERGKHGDQCVKRFCSQRLAEAVGHHSQPSSSSSSFHPSPSLPPGESARLPGRAAQLVPAGPAVPQRSRVCCCSPSCAYQALSNNQQALKGYCYVNDGSSCSADTHLWILNLPHVPRSCEKLQMSCRNNDRKGWCG